MDTDRTREVKCVDCHKRTMNDRQKHNEPPVAADRCISCHAKEKLPQRDCSMCHQVKGKAMDRVEPPSHNKTWPVNHGREARWSPALGHGKQCELCHRKTDCVACHRTQRPRDHTGLWRLVMHGSFAKWDRERCKTCHETGACVSCHRRTRPLNHRGAWIRNHGRVVSPGFEERCNTCHSQAWCTNCHKSNN
jgi:hypothetical protein